MRNHWFRRFGWFHMPVSWQGGILWLAGLAFCIQVFMAIDRHSHSVSDTLYGIFQYFACCFLLLDWVAANTSEPRV